VSREIPADAKTPATVMGDVMEDVGSKTLVILTRDRGHGNWRWECRLSSGSGGNTVMRFRTYVPQYRKGREQGNLTTRFSGPPRAGLATPRQGLNSVAPIFAS